MALYNLTAADPTQGPLYRALKYLHDLARNASQGGGAGNVLVFQPGGTADPAAGVYTSFAALDAAVAGRKAPFAIFFDASHAPLGISLPAGTFSNAGGPLATWFGLVDDAANPDGGLSGKATLVNVEAGCHVAMPARIAALSFDLHAADGAPFAIAAGERSLEIVDCPTLVRPTSLGWALPVSLIAVDAGATLDVSATGTTILDGTKGPIVDVTGAGATLLLELNDAAKAQAGAIVESAGGAATVTLASTSAWTASSGASTVAYAINASGILLADVEIDLTGNGTTTDVTVFVEPAGLFTIERVNQVLEVPNALAGTADISVGYAAGGIEWNQVWPVDSTVPVNTRWGAKQQEMGVTTSGGAFDPDAGFEAYNAGTTRSVIVRVARTGATNGKIRVRVFGRPGQ